MSKENNSEMKHITLHKPKKAWYKRVWVWMLVVFVIAVIAASSGSKDDKASTAKSSSSNQTVTETKSARWDAAAYYDQIQTGQTKAEVEQITTKTSDNCSSSETPGVGTMEFCSYGGLTDKGSISVTYLDGKVYSKTKSTY